MLSVSLLSTLLLAFTVISNPIVVRDSPVKLKLNGRFNLKGASSLLQRDRARAISLLARAGLIVNKSHVDAEVVNEPLEDGLVCFFASVGIGNPPTYYQLIVDTGSSNTWIGGNKSYIQTSTSFPTHNNVSATYGSGSFSGFEIFDTVTLADNFVVVNQSIGVATNTTNLTGVDGILGIGPTDLTNGTLSPDKDTLIPTVTDNAFSQGIIYANKIGILFEPTTSSEDLNGEMTWGDIDRTKLTSSVVHIPITTKFPARRYWGIDQSVQYGTSTIILNNTAGFVDTGTTALLLDTGAFQRYTEATGAVFDNDTQLFRITAAQYENLQSLFFNIRGVTFELTANAQIWPRSMNTAINGTTDAIYLLVGDLGTASGKGVDFVNGMAFLQRFYSVYDTANQQVGLATTVFTNAITN